MAFWAYFSNHSKAIMTWLLLLWKKSLSNMLDLIARIEICTYLGDIFSRTSWVWLFMQTIFIKKKRLQGQLTRFTVAIGWNIFRWTMLIFMHLSFFRNVRNVKFRFSEKAIKTWKNLPLVLTLISKLQKNWEIFSNFVAFSQYLNVDSLYWYNRFLKLFQIIWGRGREQN